MFTKIIFAAILFVSVFAQQPAKGTITVKITGLSSNEGELKVALYNSKENYEGGKAFRAESLEIKNLIAEINFEELPYGTYAIKLYHDENSNGEIDKGMFGIPTEDYAFSNNATGSFGPASFEDAKFELNQSTIIQNLIIN